MTPEQIALVQSSFQRLGPELPDMTARFYRQLFSRDPSLHALFTTDQALQEARFADKLTEIVRAMPRLGDLLELTRELGARHVGYGVRVSHYAIVGDALFAALGAVLGDHFDAATRDAWSVGYNLVAETMLEGAATARNVRS
jgi:hemoglobin-like flavoprotein